MSLFTLKYMQRTTTTTGSLKFERILAYFDELTVAVLCECVSVWCVEWDGTRWCLVWQSERKSWKESTVLRSWIHHKSFVVVVAVARCWVAVSKWWNKDSSAIKVEWLLCVWGVGWLCRRESKRGEKTCFSSSFNAKEFGQRASQRALCFISICFFRHETACAGEMRENS